MILLGSLKPADLVSGALLHGAQQKETNIYSTLNEAMNEGKFYV